MRTSNVTRAKHVPVVYCNELQYMCSNCVVELLGGDRGPDSGVRATLLDLHLVVARWGVLEITLPTAASYWRTKLSRRTFWTPTSDGIYYPKSVLHNTVYTCVPVPNIHKETTLL